MVLADPAGSVLADYVKTGTARHGRLLAVEGIGEDFVPPIADLSRVRKPTRSPTRKASRPRASCCGGRHSRRLIDRHAAGRGAALLPRAERARSASSLSSATAATNTCRRCTTTTGCSSRDSSSAQAHGDLRDLIARRYEEAGWSPSGPTTRCSPRSSACELCDVSQLPVLEEAAPRRHPRRVRCAAWRCTKTLRTSGTTVRMHDRRTWKPLPPGASLAELEPMFDAGTVAMIVDDAAFPWADHARRSCSNYLRRSPCMSQPR